MSLEKIISNAYKVIAEAKFGTNGSNQTAQIVFKK